jgi:hypothetical protein
MARPEAARSGSGRDKKEALGNRGALGTIRQGNNMSNKKCADCGSQLALDAGYYAEGFKKDVCQECFYEIVKTCQICRKDDVMPSEVSEYIVCKAELSTTDNRPPGIYRIKRRPFLSIPLIGSASMDGGDLLFIDKLPKRDREFEISGHICRDCAAPFEFLFQKIYGGLAPDMPFYCEKSGNDSASVNWEAVHVRTTFEAAPDAMRDLECEPDDYHWQDIKNTFKLPDLPTYHEWLLLEFGGVKVFSTGDTMPGGWASLRPDPKYRGQYPMGIVFAISGLPTYDSIKQSKFPKYNRYYDHGRELDKAAMKAAIRSGMLTQNGVFDKAGQLLRCG